MIEARDGSLESVSNTLSIRPHLILECTVPLTCQQCFLLKFAGSVLEFDNGTLRWRFSPLP